jgi:hypothetical protein
MLNSLLLQRPVRLVPLMALLGQEPARGKL